MLIKYPYLFTTKITKGINFTNCKQTSNIFLFFHLFFWVCKKKTRLLKNSFQEKFILAYPDFNKKLLSLHPDLTPSELKICLFLKMNFNTNEICVLTNQKLRTVENKRYRLRKKLGLKPTESLTNYIIQI